MNTHSNTEAATETANNFHNEPSLETLVANAEAYVRGLCSQYKLSDDDVYEVWQSAREMLAEFAALDVNLSSFQSEFERKTFPYVLLKNYQRKYGDTAKYLVNQKLYRSQIPFSSADAWVQLNEAWGLLLQFMLDDTAYALNRTTMSLTKGASFKDAVECSCLRFCKCPKVNGLPTTVLGWVEKFAKHAGEAWRTEHRYRDQDLDNARADARKKGLSEPEKPDQTQVWEQGPVYADRYSYNSKSTSGKAADYDAAPDVNEYEDTANILDVSAGNRTDENGESAADYDDHSPTAVRQGAGQTEKAQRFKRELQSKDVRGISCNIGPRYSHNRIEKPNAELDAALDAWSINHVTQKFQVRVATAEEWAKWSFQAVDFQEDEKHSTLAGYANDAYREHGQFRLGDLLPNEEEPDFDETLRKAQADRWFHRELGSVKILRRLSDQVRVWVFKGGKEHLVLAFDLRNEPWPKEKKPRKARKKVAEAVLVVA